jgi:sugar phosphate isomerase/epimerase
MRFGVMAMQMNMLIPSGVPPQEMMAQVLGFEHTALVRRIHDSGFKLIELGGDLTLFFPSSYSPGAVEALAQLKAELGLSYTLHLPLWSVEPSTPLGAVREGSVQALVENMRAASPLQPECYVLHATGALAAEFYQMRLPPESKPLILRYFQSNALRSLETILLQTGIPSRKLAIETIEFPFDLTLAMADELDLSICLDTGHILVGFSGALGLFDVLEQVLPRLAEIHLHDAPWQGVERTIGYGKDHQRLGTGDLDVPRLLDRLMQASYCGPIIFEQGIPDALASLEHIRSLRPEAISPDMQV